MIGNAKPIFEGRRSAFQRVDAPAVRAAPAGLCCLVLLGSVLASLPARAVDREKPKPLITVRLGSLATILGEVKASPARAVLVNVWATWCEPCRDELPDILKYYRDHAAKGLRLVMVSADDEGGSAEVAKVLAAAAAAAGVPRSLPLVAFIKTEDDTAFVNGMDPRWSGALPASFIFDEGGERRHSWLRAVTYEDLQKRLSELLTEEPTTIRTKSKTKSKTTTDTASQNQMKSTVPPDHVAAPDVKPATKSQAPRR